MRVVAVIVNYRSASLIADLLTSMTAHGCGWLTGVIVVDNASGDGSLGILEAKIAELGIASWVSVIDSGRNRGFGAGNNFGAIAAMKSSPQPDVLWFLNPDTLVDTTDLHHALAWFEQQPNVGLVGTGLNDPQGQEHLGGHRALTPLGEFVRLAGAFGFLRRYAPSGPELDRPGPVDWVSGASLLIRTSVWTALRGFDEGFFLYFEEVDLCRRAKTLGWQVVYEPRVRIVHLEGQTTGVGRDRPMPRYWYESRKRYFCKHFGRRGLVLADVAWLFGRFVRVIRGRGRDSCRLRALCECDLRAWFGKDDRTVEHS